MVLLSKISCFVDVSEIWIFLNSPLLLYFFYCCLICLFVSLRINLLKSKFKVRLSLHSINSMQNVLNSRIQSYFWRQKRNTISSYRILCDVAYILIAFPVSVRDSDKKVRTRTKVSNVKNCMDTRRHWQASESDETVPKTVASVRNQDSSENVRNHPKSGSKAWYRYRLIFDTCVRFWTAPFDCGRFR